MDKLLIFLLLFILNSCSTTKALMAGYTQNDCIEENIATSAYNSGKKGENEEVIMNYFKNCSAAYPIDYKLQKVQRQYKEGLKKYCHRSKWEQVSYQYGLEGKEYSEEVSKIKVCQIQGLSSADSGLKKGHRDGLKKYCHKDIWEKKGFELGKNAQDVNRFDESIKTCSVNNVSTAKRAIETGYKKGIKLFCQSYDWRNKIVDLAKKASALDPVLEKAQLCVHFNADRKAIEKVKSLYQQAQNHYCTLEYAYQAGMKESNFDPHNCPSELVEKLEEQYKNGQKNKQYSQPTP